MQIEAKYDLLEEPHKSEINITVWGSGGDSKQPIRRAYLNVTISRAAARKLRDQITKLIDATES